MMSTLGWRRMTAPTVVTTEKPRPSTVPMTQSRFAAVSAETTTRTSPNSPMP